jgi:glycine betaine/proline transport system ATP-binding protein
MLKKGMSKQEVFDKTGMSVGVNNANFTVKNGEMGLSGSGKSTIIRMLNRLIEPTSGDVYVDEKNVFKMSQDQLVKFRLHNMSMVFQSFALMPHLTVLENVAFGLELAKVGKKKQKERAIEALAQVALAADLDMLLMDEAFSALDPLIRTEMQDELLKLQEEQQYPSRAV